jgi:hypothetical protein
MTYGKLVVLPGAAGLPGCCRGAAGCCRVLPGTCPHVVSAGQHCRQRRPDCRVLPGAAGVPGCRVARCCRVAGCCRYAAGLPAGVLPGRCRVRLPGCRGHRAQAGFRPARRFAGFAPPAGSHRRVRPARRFAGFATTNKQTTTVQAHEATVQLSAESRRCTSVGRVPSLYKCRPSPVAVQVSAESRRHSVGRVPSPS